MTSTALDTAWDSGFILASGALVTLVFAGLMLASVKKAPKSNYDRKRDRERILRELDKHD